MKRLLGIVVILVALALSGGASPPAYRAAAQTTCGTERRSVKTLADQDAGSVDYSDVVPETVADLAHFAAPATLPENHRTAPVELTTYSLVVNLVEAKVESDHDIHLVIADPTTGDTMIAEFPDADTCAPTTASTLVAAMDAARSAFVSVFGVPPSDHFVSVRGTAQITGVGFFDVPHGQEDIAPNAIELHPVLDFEVVQGSGSVPEPTAPSIILPSVTPVSTSAVTPAPSPSAGHTFYASTYWTASTIYCDDDPLWKNLSPRYLVSFPSLEAALAALPGYHLHQPC